MTKQDGKQRVDLHEDEEHGEVMLISIGRPRRCRHHNLNSHYLQPCGLHQHHQKRSRIGSI